MNEFQKIDVLAEANRLRHAAEVAELRRENQILRDRLYGNFSLFLTNINPTKKMKQKLKLKQLALIGIGIAIIGFGTISRAQTNSTLLADLKTGGEDILSSTNWAVGGVAGHSLEKNYWLAGVFVAYDVTPQVAPIFAVDERFNGRTHVFSSVSGGVTLQLPIQPFVSLGVSNFWATPYVGELAASGSGGNVVGEITEAGFDVDIYNAGSWSFHAGADYENCQGQGVYNANYLAGHIAISRALSEGIPLALNARAEKFADRIRHTLEFREGDPY